MGASAVGVVAASPLEALYARAAQGQSVLGEGYGALVPDPNGLLELPRGFQYRAFSRFGDIMSDGNRVPNAHDGMAAFPGPNNTTILVRNHELSPNSSSTVIAPENKKYDPLAKGGTTTLVVGRNRQLIQDYASLAGTYRNCAGGLTPWNTWISCEENTSTPAGNRPGDPNNVSKKHGYNFEVPATGTGLVDPVPLVAMGRFNHEAVAVDPETGYVYQTEDRGDSCFYRFRPSRYGDLTSGVLEALVVKGQPRFNTSNNPALTSNTMAIGQAFEVEWVRIDNPDPAGDIVRQEAQAKGAATFVRGEGAWYDRGEIFFVATTGGRSTRGQVFRYNIRRNTLALFVESPSGDVLDMPDNITVAPSGEIFLCEDGGGQQFVVGVTPQGELYQFARNALNNSEFAGACFSPDGQTMFLNIYSPGITFAIWGPWARRR